MGKSAIVPASSRDAAAASHMSPGVLAGGFLFLNGVTGSGPHGSMPEDPETQIRAAFEKIGAVLAEAGLSYDAIVDITTYHIGLRTHFDLFDRIRLSVFSEPYPAWTAVEVAGLRRAGAIVEIRAIAAATRWGRF